MSLTALPPTKWILKNIQLVTQPVVSCLHKATSEVKLNPRNIYQCRTHIVILWWDGMRTRLNEWQGRHRLVLKLQSIIIPCHCLEQHTSSVGRGQFNPTSLHVPQCPPEWKQSSYAVPHLIIQQPSDVQWGQEQWGDNGGMSSDISRQSRLTLQILRQCHTEILYNHQEWQTINYG